MRACVIALACALAACAPKVQPFEAAPVGKAQLTDSAFIAADGARLPLKSWRPSGKPEAVILALHGFNDYNNAFAYPGEFFKNYGIATYAYDQRGFGAAPSPGIWAGEDNLIGDLESCLLQLKARYPRTPIYIMGESMGGALAVAALAQESFPPVDGVILVAPAVWGGDSMSPLMHGTTWLLAHLMPYYTLTGEDLKILASDNIPLLKAMYADPLIIKETRADAVYGLVQTMDGGYEKAALVNTPALILYGERDEVIPRQPVEETIARYPGPLTAMRYPDGYHMLLRDLQREAVMRDIVGWLGENKRRP